MKVELRKWTMDDCARMAEICTLLDRSYLSDQLPDPYTEDSAAWWINMALEKEGKEGVFRAILADGTVVGNISVERKPGCIPAGCGDRIFPADRTLVKRNHDRGCAKDLSGSI